MSGRIITAAAALLLGSTAVASAQVIVVFPQHSYWYGSGYYSPQTGTGVGEPPIYDYAPVRRRHHSHNWDDGRWERNWGTWTDW